MHSVIFLTFVAVACSQQFIPAGSFRKGSNNQQQFPAGEGINNQQQFPAGQVNNNQQQFPAGQGNSNQQQFPAGQGNINQQQFPAGQGNHNQQRFPAGHQNSNPQNQFPSQNQNPAPPQNQNPAPPQPAPSSNLPCGFSCTKQALFNGIFDSQVAQVQCSTRTTSDTCTGCCQAYALQYGIPSSSVAGFISINNQCVCCTHNKC